ncbi:MAG TPA: SiaB family protein kinase [Leptospiraceae bacterium]|nr:SiaB family protein kinase [Leptospiraceae bacterium]HMY66502.1 SiaB family protein kinase [Leptospiraceae bacterium]HNF12591.1 SiaB family protein kinase [Leptospiraceae bacterium]HNF23768.1 SiaB family protein kinase [Leptospiraceae bacterium]HNI25167.1 SiaB family protein kinase [Leptospiraceae bacterium]
MQSTIFDEYNSLKKNFIKAMFKGPVSQEVLAELGGMIRSSLSSENSVRNIFAVFIEMAQNILHYSEEKDENGSGIGIVKVHDAEGIVVVEAGNQILSSKAEGIKNKIDHLNTLDKEGLRKFYQQKLREPRPDGSKGAGIGFIEIARKAGDGKIVYSIDQISDEISFLSLKVFFERGEK